MVCFSGVYPSIGNSIGAYSLNIARGLSRVENSVILIHPQPGTSEFEASLIQSRDVVTLQVDDSWSESSLKKLSHQMGQRSLPRRILLQYDPDTFGHPWNYDLLDFLRIRNRHGDQVWLVIHKNFESFQIKKGPYEWIKRYHQSRILNAIAGFSSHIFISAKRFYPSIRGTARRLNRQVMDLPVPSYVPFIDNPQRALNLRKAFADRSLLVIGTFGSYTNRTWKFNILKSMQKILTGYPDRTWLCLGNGSESFVEELRSELPLLETQIQSAEGLDIAALSAHIQACDVLVQPYPEGLDTSRTSMMVALSHQRPTVATFGSRTEPIWRESGCCLLANNKKITEWCQMTEQLLQSPKQRRELALKGRETYEQYFSLDKCIDTLVSTV